LVPLFGDDVDDAAGWRGRIPRVVAEDQLEFLDSFLGNGGADAVDGVIDGVGAVDADHVGARARTTDAQAAIRAGPMALELSRSVWELIKVKLM